MRPVKTFERIALGARAEHTHTITEETVRLYAEMTGDYNHVHVDEDYARTTRFGARVAHGLLTCGFVQRSLTELVARAASRSPTSSVCGGRFFSVRP